MSNSSNDFRTIEDFSKAAETLDALSQSFNKADESLLMLNGGMRLLAQQRQKGNIEGGPGLQARRLITVGRNDPCPKHPTVKFKKCPCYKQQNPTVLINAKGAAASLLNRKDRANGRAF